MYSLPSLKKKIFSKVASSMKSVNWNTGRLLKVNLMFCIVLSWICSSIGVV